MASSIAEMLGAEIEGAPMPVKPVAPEKPTYGFSDFLLGALGAGPDKATPYRQSMTEFRRAESDYPMHTAQTVSALAQAEERRQNALRTTRYNELVSRAQADPNWTPSVSDMLVMSESAADFGQGRLRGQEFSNRELLSDPAATPEAQFHAGQGVQGQVLPRLREVSGETVNLAADPAATFQTPAQQADVAAVEALEGQRNRSPMRTGGSGADGWNMVTVGGRRLRERTNPDTGEYEYEFVTDPQMLGRERMFSERVRTAAESAVDALENISAMNFGASLGVMGIGGTPGKGILQSTKDSLRNEVSADEVRLYTAAYSGLNRALATMETAGLAPAGSFTDSFSGLAWRAGDTDIDRLYKMAEMRQTVDNAVDTALTNPAINDEMRQQLGTLRTRVHQVIPFSPRDVLQLNKGAGTDTLQQVLDANKLRQPSAARAAAPAAGGEPAPKTQAEYDALPVGTIYVDTDGQRKRKR